MIIKKTTFSIIITPIFVVQTIAKKSDFFTYHPLNQ